jgi:hypothetical protein
VLASQVAATVTDELASMGVAVNAHSSHQIPDLATLPGPIRAVFEGAFGEATGHLFLIAVPFAVAALLCVLFIKEVPLRTTIEREDEVVSEPAPELVTEGGRQ